MHQPDRPHRHAISARPRVPLWVAGVALAVATLPFVAASAAAPAGAVVHAHHVNAAGSTSHAAKTPYPQGRWDTREPSHRLPPGPNALPGYSRLFVTDFKTWLTNKQWFLFRGVPAGDPAGLFEPSHITIGSGTLKINTYKDPAYGNAWVSGGAGLYSVHPTYGAYFIRSRETGAGADDVELLWPRDGQWPPEIDIDETGVDPDSATWTVHFDTPSDQVQGTKQINILKWHTWGVVWTPTAITFIVDGYAYGQVTAPWEIPTIPMSLDLQMQSWCGISPECPTKRTSMVIDWVEVFIKK